MSWPQHDSEVPWTEEGPTHVHAPWPAAYIPESFIRTVQETKFRGVLMTRACSQSKRELSALNGLRMAEQRGGFSNPSTAAYRACGGLTKVQEKLLVL